MKSKTIGLFILMLLVIFCGKIFANDTGNKDSSLPDVSALNVLNLETAGAVALSKNPTMAAAFARVKQASARLSQARSAFFPYIDATASYSKMEMSDSSYAGNLAQAKFFDPATTSIENPEEYYQAGIRATWIVFNGFERMYMNRAAKLGKARSEYLEDETRRLILSAVAETFFAAQLAAENMKISRADMYFQERLLKEARARSELGAGSLSDEMNFEIRAASANARLLRQETAYKNRLIALATVMGLPEAEFPEDMGLAPLGSGDKEKNNGSRIMDDIDTLIAVAKQNRPDMQAANAALMAAEAEVKKAGSGFMPDVNVYASYDGSRIGDESFESEDFGNSVGVNVSYNLFSGGADLARRKEAKQKKSEAVQNLRKIQLDVVAGVRTTAESLVLAEKELDIQRSIARLVQKNRDLVEKEYSAGQTSLVRLNEAQRDLITAQGRLALSLVSLHQARFDLQASTGDVLNKF